MLLAENLALSPTLGNVTDVTNSAVKRKERQNNLQRVESLAWARSAEEIEKPWLRVGHLPGAPVLSALEERLSFGQFNSRTIDADVLHFLFSHVNAPASNFFFCDTAMHGTAPPLAQRCTARPSITQPCTAPPASVTQHRGTHALLVFTLANDRSPTSWNQRRLLQAGTSD
ncbi:hypothetical protein C0Q70_00811 [Pomacea canaliculata]|uniref:Uncharacterized protein n=1 Tax=Pomacea canaliculata TaxID=400727 RepID=A0A2T7PXT0_POMCA|nr:hypothetical protein C0Q70_00811 [Pomacea canaliculata]